eukprot:1161643-Pelagomonas_calceolata.AAC.9
MQSFGGLGAIMGGAPGGKALHGDYTAGGLLPSALGLLESMGLGQLSQQLQQQLLAQQQPAPPEGPLLAQQRHFEESDRRLIADVSVWVGGSVVSTTGWMASTDGWMVSSNRWVGMCVAYKPVLKITFDSPGIVCGLKN